MTNYITYLKLNNFRNHANLTQEFSENSVIVIGDNGIGKTNILENLSLLAPGRGLRNSRLEEMVGSIGSNWKAEVCLKTAIGSHSIKLEFFKDKNNKSHKQIECDGSKTKSGTELLDFLSIIWLTPQMDQLVSGPSSDRRKFFDRIVFNFYPDHARTINKYEKLVRERSEILRTSRKEQKWLEAIEAKIVEHGIAAAAARLEICEFLQKIIFSFSDKFPQLILKLDNDLEEMLTNHRATDVEEYFRKKLHDNRENDFSTGRTNTGIHRTDLLLYYKDKNMIASNCSTGEQKALLVNLVLSEAYGLIIRKNSSPILLLDEIVAHLDSERRKELFKKITNLKIQSWITGTERALFSYMENKAEFYSLSEMGLKKF